MPPPLAVQVADDMKPTAKIFFLLALLLGLARVSPAQDQELDLKDMLDTAAQWAQENLDADVLAWFMKGGRGYQTRINRALRKLMEH